MPLKEEPTPCDRMLRKAERARWMDGLESRSTSLTCKDFTAIKRAVTGPAEFAS
jgi:hypothetical protein